MRNKWTVLTGTIIAYMFSYSPAIQGLFGVYLKPIAEDFGWDRAAVSAGYSFAQITAVLLLIPVGAFIDRYGNRGVVIAQAVGIPLVCVAYAFVPASLPLFIGVSLFAGVVESGSTPAAIASVLMQWFNKNLGLALSLAMGSLGVMNFFGPPLVTKAIELWGWRNAFLAEGAVIAAIGIVNALFLVHDNPVYLKARRDKRTAEAAKHLDGGGIWDVMKAPIFWRLALAYFFMGLMFTGTTVHFVPILTDRGVSPMVAGAFLGTMGITQVLGRLFCAAVLDRVNVIKFFTPILLAAPVAFLLLYSGYPIAYWLTPIILGVCIGVEGDVLGFLVRRWFGMRASGKTFGAFFAAFLLGTAVGPYYSGYIFDRTQSYDIALLTYTVISFAAVALFYTVSRVPQIAPRADADAPVEG